MREPIPRKEEQVREFIAHVDALAERLAPERRPQDRDQPECSQQELKALGALGRVGILSMSDLAGILKVQLSSATRTIDRLVSKGLVERNRVKRDRRIVQVKFSRKGKRIHQFVIEKRLAAGRRMLESIPPKERQMFLERMTRMTQAPPTK